jgi:glycosyltransferase involved in cell wall biosynthesis
MRVLGKDLIRNPFWWRRAGRLARRMTFDAVHCHDLDTLPVGVSLKQKSGKRLVYDAHEVFGYMIEGEVPKFVVDYTFRMERRLAPQADRIIAVNEAVKGYVDRASGKQAMVVRNSSELTRTEYRPPPGPPFTIIYLGTLHKSRFILPAIEVVSSLPDVRLIIGGSKQLTPRVEAMCAQYPNTQFVGRVPAERVLPMTMDSHAVLTMFDPAYRINQVGLPNKIFEAMAAGRPSIVTEGLMMSKIVEREECGLAVPYTKEGLRSAIEQLKDDRALADRLGRNGLEAAKREYNWDAEARKLVALYDGLERAS